MAAPLDETCIDTFKYWKKLQDIKFISKAGHLPIELYALSGADLGKLKKLEIQTGTRATPIRGITTFRMTAGYSLVKASIRNIKNAPYLTQIELRGLTFNLKYMESIHANAPNLKSPHLDDTILNMISDNEAVVSNDCTRLIDSNGSSIVGTSANSLTNLKIRINGDWEDLDFQATVRKWITYIGQKYENIDTLRLDICEEIYEFPPAPIPSFQEPLVRAISKMKQLLSYQLNIYPFPEAIARAIGNRSDIGLEKLHLYVNGDNYEEQLASINSNPKF